MKKPGTIALSSLALIGLSTLHPAQAGKAVTCETSKIAMTILQDPLNFASLTPCTNLDGSLEIRTNGSTKISGCIDGTLGTVSIARLRVKAGQDDKKANITVTIPSNQMVIVNGINTMTVADVNMKPGSSGGQRRKLKGTETETFDIGGILNVSSSQLRGTYTGNFTINAECLD